MEKNRLQASFKSLLWQQCKDYKKYYFFGILALICTHLIQSELPFMAKRIADLIFSQSTDLSAWPFFFCAIGIIIFRTSSRILFFYPARLLQKSLRSELVEKLEANPPDRYKKYSSGQIFQHLSGDIEQMRALIGFVGLQGVNFIIAFLVLIPKMIEFNRDLLIALLPLIFSFAIFSFVVARNRVYFKKTQEAQGEVQNLIMETYVGKKTIRNFHAEESFLSLFKELSLKELYFFYRSSLGVSFTLPLIAFGIGISMLWGAYLIKSQDLGASSLILFSGFIFLFMEPLGYLTWVGVVLSSSHASWSRLGEFNKNLLTPTKLEGQIDQLNNHSGHQLQIPYWEHVLNIDIKENAWNVIVAKTGHGKSELLLKIAESLRVKKKTISFVAQDPYIYNDTVYSNIFLGKIPNEDEVKTAKKLLKIFGLDYIDSNIQRLLEMEVGENGKRLSGGQAKRLCLVRSLMSGSPLLIWDDPFSSVDLILEKEIVNELKKDEILFGKTIVLTSHRLSTVKLSDIVIYVDQEAGIIEEGTTTELLNEQSRTYEYFQQQMV